MAYKKILILGGAGNTGRYLARYLLQETELALVLGGRNVKRAESLAGKLNDEFGPGRRVTAAAVDASDAGSLRQAFGNVDYVVVASSTAEYAGEVAHWAIEAGIDYFDVQYSRDKLVELQSMAGEIEAAGRCFVTEGGFHPGLPAALVRYVAPQFDTLERALVGSVIKIDWASLDLAPETMAEFVAEFADFQGKIYRDGRWQELGWLSMMKPVTMDYGPPFGKQYALPMFLEEMRAIPELFPDLRDTGFYVGGLNWFVDWLLSPIIWSSLRIAPRRSIGPMARLMRWGLNTFSGPPYGTLLKVGAEGQKDDHELSVEVLLSHDDGYIFTAIPAACCLLQLLDGTIGGPGLWLQANIVDPKRLMVDMKRLGIEIHEERHLAKGG